jgi:glycosyltransferase involved in cell wall biosynthesis
MEKNLVSIIVPIYNVEKYIEKCVKSILEQDYKNIEVILVDDGSPDGSPKLIDKFKKMDSRVIVLHKPNGGVSSARNAGIDIAKGEYILFIDGDDWIESDYVSYFINLVKTFDLPIGMNKNFYSVYNKVSSEKIYSIDSLKVSA